ncbi:hypothetical protein HZS_5209, partial [Henneguya salminicola]
MSKNRSSYIEQYPDNESIESNTREKKPIRFLKHFFKCEEKQQNTNLQKIKRKRVELAKKIFDHIQNKNKKYFENIENFHLPNDNITFSQFEQQLKLEDKVETPQEIIKKNDFDHLEILRPYLNILNEYKQEQPLRPKFENKKSLSKVSQNEYERWSTNIMWTSSDLKGDYRNDIHTIIAGWIPAGNQRTWSQFLSNGIHGQVMSSNFVPLHLYPQISQLHIYMANSLCILANADNDLLSIDPNKWFSLFPVAKEEIQSDDWMNTVILKYDDVFCQDEKLTIDPISEIDYYVNDEIEKNERKKIGLNENSDSLMDTNISNTIIDSPKRLFFISADDYYLPPKRNELIENEIYSTHIKHSLPALDLQRTLFPTYMDILHLRRWHRPLLSEFDHGTKMKVDGVHKIQNLHKYNEESLKIYQEIIDASGSQEVFLMKTMKDLTAMNGHLVLIEYSEEYPLLVSHIGMNSILRTYFGASNNKEISPPKDLEYGDIVVIPSNMSPFLGSISPGESLMAIENNMFRAPIYRHSVRKTDFLIIKSTHGYFIRRVPVIFTVGQEHPKIEVPGPNSKTSMRCARERLQTYIFRLFMKNKDKPKRLKIASVRRAFKQHSENSIRKRLKTCAHYFRQSGTAGKSNWWILKDDFRLPTHEDMHERLQPETVCAYYSMLACQRRLKDAGYGKKSLFMAEEENDEETDNNKSIDEEILCAPWHTTRAFILSQKGKCLLTINGFADPTGCGEGFSYVRQNYKSVREESSKQILVEYGNKKSKTITGTDADLRRLRVGQCRQILHEMGIPYEKIDKMQRWDMINLIRSLGSQSSKAGNLQDAIGKFARHAKFSNIENIDKYREECQAIFELQNRCLGSCQEFSSDEEEMEEDDSDIDELTKDLESMLNNKREAQAYHVDEEEHGRLDLLKLLGENKSLIDEEDNVVNGTISVNVLPENKVNRLLIHRTFLEGQDKFVRTEVVTDPRIISAYLRITKNANYRQVYARHDTKTMEELRKEKKRVQDQLRRIKRHEERETVKKKDIESHPKKEKSRPKLHVRCTACGEVGHMRTNRICSKYQETHPNQFLQSPDKSSDSYSTGGDKQTEQQSMIQPVENLVKVEGTRLVVGKALIQAADELTRKSLLLKISKDSLGKKRKKGEEYYSEYLTKQYRNTYRRRADPSICLNAIFEDIVNKLKELPDSWPFLQPVCPKKVPDYLNIVINPIDLQTIKDKSKNCQYNHRDKFIDDLKLIHSNSILYNGLENSISTSAQSVFQESLKLIEERQEEILSLEREINPLLSQDPQTKISWLLNSIISNAKLLTVAHPFLYPVNIKLVRDYNLYVQKPMDLETIKNQCSTNYYTSCDMFMKDVDLILNNCISYNGLNHAYTKMAEELHHHILTMLEKNQQLLCEFEEKFKKSKGIKDSSESSPPLKITPQSNSLLQENNEGSVEVSDGVELLEDLELSHENSENE